MEVILLFLTMNVVLLSEASSQACRTYIDRSGASISSPNFPEDYNDNEKCTYHLVAPTGSVVMIYFNHLDIEGKMEEQCHDFLQVNASDVSRKRIRKLCGFNLPSPIYSLANEMFLTFQTDSSNTESGFHATVFFTKPKQPYLPTDGIYVTLHFLIAINVTIIIIIALSVISCIVLYKRNLVQINFPERTQVKEHPPFLNGESPGFSGTTPFDVKDELHDTPKEMCPTPETSQRYLEMKPSFKKNKITVQPVTSVHGDNKSIYAPGAQYTCPVIKPTSNAAEKRNTVEYSEPSNDFTDSNKSETNITIPKSEYINAIIENDENNSSQDAPKDISPTPESSQCYLEMRPSLKKIKITGEPEKYPEKPFISTYGDTNSADTPEAIYACPIIKSTPNVAKKRDTVEYSEPSEIDVTGSNICQSNTTIPKSEYSKAIIENNENNPIENIENEGDLRNDGQTESTYFSEDTYQKIT